MKIMEKSTKGLFDFLCDRMQDLNDGKITYHDLMAYAAATRQLNNLVRLELDFAKFKGHVNHIQNDRTVSKDGDNQRRITIHIDGPS